MDVVKQSFHKAHNAVRANPIVIWFPMLFATAVWIFYLLLFLLLMTRQIPAIMEIDLLSIPAEVMVSAAPTFGFLAVIAIVLILIQTAGVLGLQARTVRGGNLEARDYFLSVKYLLLRITGLQMIMMLMYALPIILLSCIMFFGPWGAKIIGAEQEIAVKLFSPFFFIGTLLIAAVYALFAIWPLNLALNDGTLFDSMKKSVGFMRRHFRSAGMVILFGWAIAILSNSILDNFSLGQLLQLGVSFVIRTYIVLTLMFLYLTESESGSK